MSNHRRLTKGESAKEDLLIRIKSIEEAIAKSREYLASGKYADWAGFRPYFVTKFRDGKELPPHRDWVRNVYLPNSEKALSKAEDILEKLTEKEKITSGR
ncbi:MAG: hypothetical protein H7210_12620 [Pyrinomonadaceae bacterium]|nr:hypothetical protein [Phycisphaerales bacterium]